MPVLLMYWGLGEREVARLWVSQTKVKQVDLTRLLVRHPPTTPHHKLPDYFWGTQEADSRQVSEVTKLYIINNIKKEVYLLKNITET